jgi:hypothetical protein
MPAFLSLLRQRHTYAIFFDAIIFDDFATPFALARAPIRAMPRAARADVILPLSAPNIRNDAPTLAAADAAAAPICERRRCC